MSGLQSGFACCACALSVALSGCGDSQSPVETIDTGMLVIDDAEPPVGDDPVTEPGLPPLVAQPAQDAPVINLGPEGDSGVTVNTRRYPLDSALGDIWGVEDDHYNVDFTLTNGKFLVNSTVIDGITHSLLVPVKATAIVYAELYSPGESLAFVTYSYSPFGAGGGVLAGNAFFDQAYVGMDTNNSGDVEDDEKILITGGTVEFTGTLPDIELRFSVTLENGETAEGHYTGLFDFADRR